ncbi:MAG: glycosyltransferase family 4 protein [Anaerolineae bacterium]|nr:glycosyltransferase family 4 protein [Anaerolineae bacterium]
MRLLILSLEYPPYVVGGLGRHVAELAPALAGQRIDVHVVTPTATMSDVGVTIEQGVTVHRVFAPSLNAKSDVYDRVTSVNHTLEHYLLHQQDQKYDLIHVHDWLTGFAGIRLQRAWRIPLVATIHATERGRGRGYISNDLQRAIDEAERVLIHTANHLIVCSRYMAEEVQKYFHTNPGRIDVVPNGVDIAGLHVNSHPTALTDFRARYADEDDRIVFSVARLVHEKGLHRLVDAAPVIFDEFPQARIIIAGKGPEAEHLQRTVNNLGISDRVTFVGFISDEERNMFFKIASCAIFPSLYEPFGIVALEAMALGCPVIVSDVGGLAEIVNHTENGLTIYPDDAESVAWGVLRVLNHPKWALERADRAYKYVDELFNWSRIARLTRAVYRRTLQPDQTAKLST